MTFYAGETGRTIRLNAGWDMSENTDIKIVFVLPDRTTISKGRADGVAMGTVDVVDPTLGQLGANEYVEFEATSDLFQVEGDWYLYLQYEDSDLTPAEVFFGDSVRVLVKPRAEMIPASGAC